MDIPGTVRALGGVVRTMQVTDRGARPSRVSRLVADGALTRPSRGWLAVPDADPQLIAAAEIGVVITCVTRAARLGLWDVGSAAPHVGVAPHQHIRRPTSAHVHWNLVPMPRDPARLEDGVENALALVADCQPFEDALAIWESGMRTGLVELDTMRTLDLGPRARRIVDEAMPFADSGVESIVIPRLRWLGLRLMRQTWILGHRVDLLIGDRLVLQIDGGHHVDAQRLSDNAHDARLRLAGYHVIRVGYWQVRDDWAAVQELITGAIARGLHLAR